MTEVSGKGLDWLDHSMKRHSDGHFTIKHWCHTCLSIFVGSMSLFTVIDTEFFPEADESQISATLELQTGTRVEQTIITADKIDNLIKTNILK